MLFRHSKPLNSLTNNEDTPTLIFFKGKEKKGLNKEGREFSVLVNLNKVNLGLEKTSLGRDILDITDGQEMIVKLEFVYDEEDFTIAELHNFVVNRQKTVECAKQRVKFGIVSVFHLTYSKSNYKKQKELLRTIENEKRISKDLFDGYNPKNKIACLAERESFSTEKLRCLVSLCKTNSESLYRDADKIIFEEVSNYGELMHPVGINALLHKITSMEYLEEKCGMNVLN